SRPVAADIVSATLRTRVNMKRGSCHPVGTENGRFLRVIPVDDRFRARMVTFIRKGPRDFRRRIFSNS
ncbi:MAG: hypothetical protein ABJC79_10570, partial [Acidimicrobiia bacterium]